MPFILAVPEAKSAVYKGEILPRAMAAGLCSRLGGASTPGRKPDCGPNLTGTSTVCDVSGPTMACV